MLQTFLSMNAHPGHWMKLLDSCPAIILAHSSIVLLFLQISRVRTPCIILVLFWSFYLLPNPLLLLLFTPSSPTRVNDRDTVFILGSSFQPNLLLNHRPSFLQPPPEKKLPFLSPWGPSSLCWLLQAFDVSQLVVGQQQQVIGRGTRHVTACDCGPATDNPGPNPASTLTSFYFYRKKTLKEKDLKYCIKKTLL